MLKGAGLLEKKWQLNANSRIALWQGQSLLAIAEELKPGPKQQLPVDKPTTCSRIFTKAPM